MDDVAIGKRHAVKLAIAFDGDFEFARQGIDDGYADTVQAAGELVVLVGKFAACVQGAEDDFDPRFALFGVDVDRHSAPVVGDGY